MNPQLEVFGPNGIYPVAPSPQTKFLERLTDLRDFCTATLAQIRRMAKLYAHKSFA
jgi:hypothetical protein